MLAHGAGIYLPARWAAWTFRKDSSMSTTNKHDVKWLNYEDDGRNEPGVKLRITRRYIELMGGFLNAIAAFHKNRKDGQ